MKHVWLIGAGGMAQDYIKVLKNLDIEFTVIGRNEENAKRCAEASNCHVVSGGLESYLAENPEPCTHAVVAVGVEKLYETTKLLLESNVKNILVEKPGAMQRKEFEELSSLSKENNAQVYIAYNRRFYASVLEAQKIIAADGGVTSFNFEFTEWAHEIKDLRKAAGVKEKWFLANSTHVVDLAFFLGGAPKEIAAYTGGSLEWHPSASNFSGAGISQKGALFSYQANWESAGRWGVEMLTQNHRLIFRPMEKLQIQKRGSIAQEFAEIDYGMDTEYKPGLYHQVKAFLHAEEQNLCSLEEQSMMIHVYNQIANYRD